MLLESCWSTIVHTLMYYAMQHSSRKKEMKNSISHYFSDLYTICPWILLKWYIDLAHFKVFFVCLFLKSIMPTYDPQGKLKWTLNRVRERHRNRNISAIIVRSPISKRIIYTQIENELYMVKLNIIKGNELRCVGVCVCVCIVLNLLIYLFIFANFYLNSVS